MTWDTKYTTILKQDGATLPIWDIAIAPDDENLIAVITSDPVGPAGPKQIYISKDGGDNWEYASAGISIGAGYISCIDISPVSASGLRYIAIGTRTGTAIPTGAVWTFKYTTSDFCSWANQSIAPSTGWTAADVIDIKFSPNYTSDLSIAALTSNAAGTYIYLGSHDLIANNTVWKTNEGYPVLVEDIDYVPSAGTSPSHTQIITAQLDLPEDFLGSTFDMRTYYLCTDSIEPNTQAGIYRVDDTAVHRINPPTSLRISSIDYYGIIGSGQMLAGEVTTDANTASVRIWAQNSESNSPVWYDAQQAPTGGANSGYANAQVKWGPDGDFAYCGTSTAPVDLGGVPNWPFCYLSGALLDESAFSISPYSPDYSIQLDNANKSFDTVIGDLWNKISLIDTEITRLSDVTAIQSRVEEGYDVLYLSSLNSNGMLPLIFYSIWRSTTKRLRYLLERILCLTRDTVYAAW
jgi:hypothetical protein